MSITIKDCLQLPSLSLGSVIAGEKGINSIVNTVSVVEFDVPGDSYSISNELLLSALYSIKDDVDAQCRALEEYKLCGEVGLVLFYTDRILKKIDDKLIETANRLNFPIIVLPRADMGLRYSDVISEVMEAIFMDKKNRNFFVDNTLERLAQLAPSKRTINSPLYLASDYAKAAFFLCDGQENLIGFSYWPKTNAVSFSHVLNQFRDGSAGKYISTEKDGQIYRYFKHPFINKDGAQLYLLAASKNNRLTSTIMEQVVEIIQLFAAIWNYNLNLTAKESLIPALIEGDLELAQHICRDHLIKLSDYNAFAILNFEKEMHEKKKKDSLISRLREIFCDVDKGAIIDTFANYVIILFSYSCNLAKDHILLEEVIGEIDRFGDVENYTLFSNITAAQVRQFYISYTEQIHAAKSIYPHKTFFNNSEIDFAGKCRAIISSLDGGAEKYLQLLAPIIKDAEEDLLLTLTTYFLDADAEVKKTAELLYVHRNTIQYRLARIKSLINMDFTKFPMSFDIYTAVALRRMSAGRDTQKGAV